MKIDKNVRRGWRIPTSDTPKRLAEALEWLDLHHGRAQRYQQLCDEFARKGTHSRDQFFAYHEACGLLDIFYAWKDQLAHFPDIRSHIREVFKSGPLLSDDEIPGGANNRPRSSAFVFLLSGKLLHLKDVKVLCVDGSCNRSLLEPNHIDTLADISIQWNGVKINIECKRPLGLAGVTRCAKEAVGQINDSGRVTNLGIVGIDFSRVIREKYGYLMAPSQDVAAKHLIDELQSHADGLAIKGTNILGVVAFCRVPFLTPRNSTILQPDGRPFRSKPRSNSGSHYLFIANATSPHSSLMSSLSEGFGTTQYDVPERPLPLD